MPDLSTAALALIPVVISGVGWTVYKVIVHDTSLLDIRQTLSRLEDKLDRLIER